MFTIPSGCSSLDENAFPAALLKATAVGIASQFYALFLSHASCPLTCFSENFLKGEGVENLLGFWREVRRLSDGRCQGLQATRTVVSEGIGVSVT